MFRFLFCITIVLKNNWAKLYQSISLDLKDATILFPGRLEDAQIWTLFEEGNAPFP